LREAANRNRNQIECRIIKEAEKGSKETHPQSIVASHKDSFHDFSKSSVAGVIRNFCESLQDSAMSVRRDLSLVRPNPQTLRKHGILPAGKQAYCSQNLDGFERHWLVLDVHRFRNQKEWFRSLKDMFHAELQKKMK